jgi:lipoprotein-anchoring transpeptidase ErfK/SrfK
VSRRALIAILLVASVGFAAAVALPNRAQAGSGTGATTTTNSTTTTARSSSSHTRVESVFPAAGEIVGNSVAARKSANPNSGVIKVLHYFRPDYRVQEILAVAAQTGSDGEPWYKISLPMRPNNTYGWIPAKSVKLAPTKSQIVISVSRRTIDVYVRGKHRWHGKVAVGAPGRETPLGHYYVAARFVPYHDPFLGVFALETSAYSKLTEWPGGGVVGIHGTSLPQLLGQAVSHGCVRVSNLTASHLKTLAPLGTPILIKK